MREVLALQSMAAATAVTFPMCALGHESQKLTTLLITPGLVEDLLPLGKLKCTHKTHKQVGGKGEDGKFTSATSSKYPAELNQILVQAITKGTTSAEEIRPVPSGGFQCESVPLDAEEQEPSLFENGWDEVQ